MNKTTSYRRVVASVFCLVLGACGGGGGGGGIIAPPAAYTVGGSVTGLVSGESLSVTNSGGNALTVTANGSFSFPVTVAQGGSYAVTVTTQPIGQNCTVTYGTGSNVTANISNITVTCVNVPQYAYAVNNGSNDISEYSIAANGTLIPLNPARVPTGSAPESITIDPSHRYVYVTSLNDNTISQYVIQANGTLASNGPATVASGNGPDALSFDPAGSSAYVANVTDANVSQFTVGAGGTLAASSAAPIASGFHPWNVTITPNGKFLYVSDHGISGSPGSTVSQYAIQSVNGSLAALSPSTVSSGTFPGGSAADTSSSYLYVTSPASNSISQYAIGSGGQLSPLTPATVTAGVQVVYIGIHPNNKFAYAVNYTGAPATSGTVSQYSIGSSGQLTPLATVTAPTGMGPVWLAIDGLGQHAYVANQDDGTIGEYSIGMDGSLAVIGTVSAGTKPFAVALTN